MAKLNYISVCSGIEAATVAWHHMGWKPMSYSEISTYPSKVLQRHYPLVPNVGDMTKYKEWNYDAKPNLLVGGTPCQSFSMAGLRKGLSDPRGNLMLVYLGIVQHFEPEWVLWENVPGVLSSQGGRDFSCFISGLVELGYGCAWRVLDAKFFGSASSRRRCFVVGHRSGNFRNSARVLFDSGPNTEGTAISPRTRYQIIARSRGIDIATHQPIYSIPRQFIQNTSYACHHTLGAIEMTKTLNTMDNHLLVYQENGQAILRHMTSIEMERTMGFPDGYSKVNPEETDEHKNKTNRVHALGNSMSVHVMRWIGERMNMVHDEVG